MSNENKVTVLQAPSKGDQHEVRQPLEEAIAMELESVFIVGYKDGLLRTTYSGYKNIEEKLGAIELLKHNIINGAS